MIWKMIIQEEVDHSDLEGIDHTYYHQYKEALFGSADELAGLTQEARNRAAQFE